MNGTAFAFSSMPTQSSKHRGRDMIFIADPDRGNRESMVAILKTIDLDPITVATKEQLFDCLDDFYENVTVITETYGSVEDLVEEIRHRNPNAEIIICTTQDLPGDISDYENLGVKYIIKPDVYSPLLQHFRLCPC